MAAHGRSDWCKLVCHAQLRLLFVATVLVVACPGPALAQTASFTAPHPLGVDLGPWAVATADFNGDGALDLAVVNYLPGTVSVLLGNGDGTFRPTPIFFGGDNGPSSVAVGDFNGDGRPDLVLANFKSTTVSVFLGKGDGTFSMPLLFSAGTSPAFAAVGDFNGDGKQDLAVANYFSTTVSVLLGKGDGTFGPPVSFAAGPSPQVVAVGDLNRDGKLDLAVANAGSSTAAVMLGRGDGTFQPPQAFDVGGINPTYIAMGDLRGLGTLDLVVATYGCFYYSPCPVVSHTISVLLGNGDGTFNPPLFFEAGSGPNSVTVADFNGDGRQDLAVADYGPSTQRATTVAVLLGNGDGTFQPPLTFDAGISPAFAAASDFNRDSSLDLAVVNYDGATVSVLLNATAPSQQVAMPTFSPAAGVYSGPQSVSISDATSGATIHYTTDGSTPTTASPVYGGPITVTQTTTVKAMAAASGMANSAVASATYSIVQQVAAPTFSPAAGTYTSSVTVTISDGTTGATIHYATDGSTPTTASPVYGGPITVTQTTTVKAMATASGMADSAVASATYTIRVATPAFSPAGGTYTSARSVSISDATPGATIYYTTDGSTPTTASPVYGGPITVTQTTTVKAMAAAVGMANSAVASATYTIRVATPALSPGGGTYTSAVTVTLSDSTAGATIYYTMDGSTPTTASPVYSGPIMVTQTTTIKAMAAAGGMANSAVASATYTIQQSFTLTVSVQNGLLGSGHVTSSPGGMNCGGGTCSATFVSGTVVNLAAIPDGLLSVFVSWGGACSGILDPSCTVTMTGNLSVSATFGP